MKKTVKNSSMRASFLRNTGAMMIYKPDVVLRGILDVMPLGDGDTTMSGTPAGVGPVNAGDKLVGRIREGDKVLVEGAWVAS